MKRIRRGIAIILPLCTMTLSPLQAQVLDTSFPAGNEKTGFHTCNTVSAGTSRTADTLGTERPVFPPAATAKRVREKHRIVGYPRMSVTLGPALRYQRTQNLSALHQSVEESFDVPVQEKDLRNTFLSMNLGFRYSPNPGLGFLLEKSWGRNPPHNAVSFSSVSLTVIYSFLRSELFSLSAGGGIAKQELRSKRDYHRSLPDGRILENVKFISGHRIAIPLELSLDLWPLRVSQYFGFNVTARYFLAQPAEIRNYYSEGSDQKTYSVPMDGFRIGTYFLLSF
jgi:hypothetical protein